MVLHSFGKLGFAKPIPPLTTGAIVGNAVNEGDRLGIIGFNGTGAVLENYIPQMENNLVFRIEPFEKERLVVEFHINQLWEPARVYGSADPRKLGIALYEVIYKSD